MRKLSDMPESERPRETLGIKVLDHIVFDARGHCSLMESDLQ